MTTPTTVSLDKIGLREVIPFPRIDEFYDLLQDRLHMVTGSYILQHEYTLFINALPRKKLIYINRYENVPLIYAGVRRQRELIEGEEDHTEDLSVYWNFLDSTDLNSDTAVVSSQLYRSFNMGSYSLEDIPKVGQGSLRSYFEPILEPNRTDSKPTPRQVAEYHILKNYFDIYADHYLSIPLVQFGEFDGIVHLCYHDADAQNINLRSISNLIRSYSTVIETLVLEWDLVSRNFDKAKAVMLPLNPSFYDRVNRNPILKELKFDQYYRRHLPFFQSRIRFNDNLMHSKVYRPYLKTAIMSIMIDSFAHNVSAHSLVALNWWFKRRADGLRNSREIHRSEVEEAEAIIDDHIEPGFDRDRLFELISPWIKGLYPSDVKDDYDVVRYAGSLDQEIQPLIKFLMQKGAFWSGIARDNHFGGESVSLFDVLYEDFINNPLYLGTIAKTEDIHRIRLRILHYQSDAYPPESIRHAKKVLLEGNLVVVDLKERREPAHFEEGRGYYLEMPGDQYRLYFDEHPELEQMSEFVQPGETYVALRDWLKTVRVFLPGEIVGRHAFFTILENEIRNVKHYRGDALQRIQKNGLDLCIAIQETTVMQAEPEMQHRNLVRVGVWIGEPTVLHTQQYQLVRRRFEVLRSDIMDSETFSPRLGGGFQDKICAGMLFNNRFERVQNGDGNPMRDQTDDTARDEAYYPWITPAVSAADRPHEDWEINRFNEKLWERVNGTPALETGYFKKYFHLWKAADILTILQLEDLNLVWENLARFKFLHAPIPEPRFQELYRLIRRKGVIRVIDGPLSWTDPEKTLVDAYNTWLQHWLEEDSFLVQLRVDGQIVGQFNYLPGTDPTLRYLPAWEMRNSRFRRAQELNLHVIDLAHGGNSEHLGTMRYRNHGIYRSYFQSQLIPGERPSTRARLRAAELFESLLTRVVIFDNRIFGRVRSSQRLEAYRHQLKLSIFGEGFSQVNEQGEAEMCCEFEARKKEVLCDCHFLIIHLSYIEKILLRKYADDPEYEEENIGLFIQRDIVPHVVDSRGDIRNNFVLVITTGRGRTKWWTRLQDDDRYRDYASFTIFRPVESLISATENALARQDDLELKFNLTKVLFGS